MSTQKLLHRPIYGGVFGDRGEYSLASMPCVSHGLHATRYMVVRAQEGTVLSVAEDKPQALALARIRLEAANDKRSTETVSPVQGELWPGEDSLVQQPLGPRYVSGRRREIFQRSAGRCHYCGRVLTLDGAWHVEHQFPRALGGGDDPLNLVASCVPCNMRKRDRTALEFVAKGAERR